MSTLPIMFPRLDKLVAEKLHILISWHCAKQRRVKRESPNKKVSTYKKMMFWVFIFSDKCFDILFLYFESAVN